MSGSLGPRHPHATNHNLESEPPPLASAAEVPAELKRIVAKGAQQGENGRYQTAEDLALDLKSLKEELTAESRLKLFRRSDQNGEKQQRRVRGP